MSNAELSRRGPMSSCWLFIVIALAIAAGRIAVVSSKEGDTAFLSANDRSRWATVASLVEHRTYAIDQQIAISDPIKRNRRPWNSIDKVRHLGRDGKQHFYSSKPPLLPTMIAGIYAVVHAITGMTLTEQPIYLARILLALVNLPLMAMFLMATIVSIDRICKRVFAKHDDQHDRLQRDWIVRFAGASCCFGTMVLPFAISLNNHLPAAAATAVAMCIYLVAADRLAMLNESTDERDNGSPQRNPSEPQRQVPWGWWLIAGMAAAMAAANELPALSMMTFWVVLYGWISRRSLLPMGVGIAVVAFAFFGTNWLAHQSLRPAYAHRGNGAVIQSYPEQASLAKPDAALVANISDTLRAREQVDPAATITIIDSDEKDRWIARAEDQQFAVLRSATGWQLARWDDWYEYPGSYWRPENLRGVDRGEPSRTTYLLHMTVGHHGIFSLTPLWVLVPIGLWFGLASGAWDHRRLMAAILISTLVCCLFYLARPEIDRNYGGVSVCFRWLLWFAPLWLAALSPALQKLGRSSAGRLAVGGLLALSVFSMATALSSPWQSPWLYRFWTFLGWIDA
ncbi:MAG: hypothetical protein P1U77_08220 [Rubripirellula sp.]|nr:hypothetical protein [Planctomycetaceae bacterium]MDF1841405.1 hypothetical protein [Rubripirellula sp.]